MPTKPVFNRAPLSPNAFAKLPLGSILPKGELLQRLQAQANGLGGHITEVWPSLIDNAWMGGSGDAWERGPYYLDGLIPLAHTLSDKRLMALSERFIEWILSSQDESGWFGPKEMDGYWPRMVALKALQQQFEVSGDKRILRFMHAYFKCQYKRLDEQPLELWAIARAGENVQTALWLYNIVGDKGLLRLCEKLLSNSIDWTAFFSSFPYMRDLKKEMPWINLSKALKETDDPRSAPYMQHQMTHVVNLAMALKTPGLEFALGGGLKQAEAFFAGYEKLMKAHGVANGMFTGDEHLSGASPSQGTETCAVVEMLHTLETLMGQFADARLGDLYERIGYNALPAALHEDGWAHQYDQQVNQIRISDDIHIWYNNRPDSNVFGLEPNFGCCTANLHQGLPKFAAHLWMATREGGLVCQSLAPCTVKTRINGQSVALDVDGNYPQGGETSIRLSLKTPAAFPIVLRIPAFAKGISIQAGGEIYAPQPGSFLTLQRTWEDGDRIAISIPLEPYTEKWFHQSVSVYKGSLLYALPIKAKWSKQGEGPVPNYLAEPEEKWNYGIDLKSGLSVDDHGNVLANFSIIEDWAEKNGVAEAPPVLPAKTNENKMMQLLPYSKATLRIAQFPQTT